MTIVIHHKVGRLLDRFIVYFKVIKSLKFHSVYFQFISDENKNLLFDEIIYKYSKLAYAKYLSSWKDNLNTFLINLYFMPKLMKI